MTNSPKPRLGSRGYLHFRYTPNDDVIGEHVKVVVVQFTGRTRGRRAFEDQRGHQAVRTCRLSSITLAPCRKVMAAPGQRVQAAR